MFSWKKRGREEEREIILEFIIPIRGIAHALRSLSLLRRPVNLIADNSLTSFLYLRMLGASRKSTFGITAKIFNSRATFNALRHGKEIVRRGNERLGARINPSSLRFTKTSIFPRIDN